MNKLMMFCIFDSKTQSFRAPFYARTAGEAERSFSAILKEKNQLSEFPEDFSLHHVGYFDEQKGEVFPCKHLNLGLASQFMPQGNLFAANLLHKKAMETNLRNVMDKQEEFEEKYKKDGVVQSFGGN